jgi:hypothetical protein
MIVSLVNKMLFQSDYWLATGLNEKTETIIDFLESDAGIQSLVIYDKTGADSIEQILNSVFLEDSACHVVLVIGNNISNYKTEAENPFTKTIYVRYDLDESTIALLKNVTPIFAIFV